MPITGLLHVAIKTEDLDATVAFYTKVIGLRLAPRPDFGFAGAWLAVPTAVGEAVMHIHAGGPALGTEGRVRPETGSIDHVSVTAVGWNVFRERFAQAGLPWREFLIPGTTYSQLFIYDPSGVQLELTFDAHGEGIPTPDVADAMRYRAGTSFFDPACYAGLAQRLASVFP